MFNKRLVVISNRLPIAVDRSEDQLRLRPGTGGLITALAPIMKREHGLWIGWPGERDATFPSDVLDRFARENEYNIHQVPLSSEEVEKFYLGFSNTTIWPLFHDLLGHTKFERENWQAYNDVNRKYAERTAEALEEDDIVWIHDYQLMMVGRHLRDLGVRQQLAYFLHIPFPTEDLYRRIPWKREIMHSLLEYDMLGFQTRRDRNNFVECAAQIVPDIKIDVKPHHANLYLGDRKIRVGDFPISIDFDEFNDAASCEEVENEARRFHKEFNAHALVLGVDRLDYTKGIPARFLAFERMLDKYPEMLGKLSLFQLVIPSRTLVPDYQRLKDYLDQLVGRINGRFYRRGWVPIHYMYGTLPRPQLVGVYRACDIALITPLRDGMNLVAKEYCASQIDMSGVLILSEFAGAADQLANDGAVIVNPYDREGTADAIYNAFHMSSDERKSRMTSLRMSVKYNDVHRWVHYFLGSFAKSEALAGAQA